MQKAFRFLVPLFLVVSTLTGYSQENTRLLKGSVKNFRNDVSDVLIINSNTKQSTITDALGEFTIEVNLGDSLRFTAVQYQTKNIGITGAVLRKTALVVYLVENVINLSEVTVTPYNLTGQIDKDIERLALPPALTSSTLNLPNAGIEKMTQSERLLIEADRGKYVYCYVTALVINTHKIMNRLSGRTKSFEEMVARDSDMALEKKIITTFSKETISEDFDIPKTNIDGFLSYCMAQRDFSDLSQAGNTAEIWAYLRTRSIEFKSADPLKE